MPRSKTRGALWAVEWRREDDALAAVEPTDAEIDEAAPRLAAFYNDTHNRRMLAHTDDLSGAEVAAFYRELRAEGGHPFLLRLNGELMGDADIRNVERATAETAILVGAQAKQGRGLGTRYALMVHAFAFRSLGVRRLYASIIPANQASLRLFEKLGYRRDDSRRARALIDDATDVTLSIPRADFEARWARELAEIHVVERAATPPPRAGR